MTQFVRFTYWRNVSFCVPYALVSLSACKVQLYDTWSFVNDNRTRFNTTMSIYWFIITLVIWIELTLQWCHNVMWLLPKRLSGLTDIGFSVRARTINLWFISENDITPTFRYSCYLAIFCIFPYFMSLFFDPIEPLGFYQSQQLFISNFAYLISSLPSLGKINNYLHCYLSTTIFIGSVF